MSFRFSVTSFAHLLKFFPYWLFPQPKTAKFSLFRKSAPHLKSCADSSSQRQNHFPASGGVPSVYVDTMKNTSLSDGSLSTSYSAMLTTSRLSPNVFALRESL